MTDEIKQQETNVITMGGESLSNDDIEFNLEREEELTHCQQLLEKCKEMNFKSISLVGIDQDDNSIILNSNKDMKEFIFNFERVKAQILSA